LDLLSLDEDEGAGRSPIKQGSSNSYSSGSAALRLDTTAWIIRGTGPGQRYTYPTTSVSNGLTVSVMADYKGTSLARYALFFKATTKDIQNIQLTVKSTSGKRLLSYT
jgi:hypothetical protein